jgi:hypothetical protein
MPNARQIAFGLIVGLAMLLVLRAPGAESAPVRVALMDFTTDDNSYRSAQSAVNFTRLVQLAVTHEPGFDWIERVELDRVRQELGLAEAHLLGGASPTRIGKLLKADWLITGQFLLDDKSQRVLFVEIVDLRHADVLASDTFRLSGAESFRIEPDKQQVEFAATAVARLMSTARRRQLEMANKITVAPLFFIQSDRFRFARGTEVLPGEFVAALERIRRWVNRSWSLTDWRKRGTTGNRLRIYMFGERVRIRSRARG